MNWGMPMKAPLKTLAVCASGLLIAACANAPAEVAEVKADPRQREEVPALCFQSQIKNWRPSGDDAVILTMAGRKAVEYRIELIGGCDPGDQRMTAAFATPDGGCLRPGATLSMVSVTGGMIPAAYTGSSGIAGHAGTCSVRSIHVWERGAVGGDGGFPFGIPLSAGMASAR